MNRLRDALGNPQASPLLGQDLFILIAEWNSANSAEKRGLMLLRINAALARKIIDPDIFLSVALSLTTSYGQFPLVGAALRHGANTNLYVNAYQLGPAHILVYAVDQARKNKLPQMETRALCVMLSAMKSSTSPDAFDENGGIISPTIENIQDFNAALIAQSVKNTQFNYKAPKIESITVEKWLLDRGAGDYTDLEKLDPTAAVRAGCAISNRAIAFKFAPKFIPSFEHLLENQDDGSYIGSVEVDNLFINYPLNNGGAHLHIREGEVLGMRQAVEAGCYAGYELFLNSGVSCSYFIINRICYLLAEECKSVDREYYNVLLSILTLSVGKGALIDTKQLNMLAEADLDNRCGIVRVIEDEYKTPRWTKFCNAASNTPVPDSLRQLAFNLGIDHTLDHDSLCARLQGRAVADANEIKNATIKKRREMIAITVSDLVDFIGGEPVPMPCSNGQNNKFKPEEYNDTLMTFYKDKAGNIRCYTSDMYADLISKFAAGDSDLPPEFIGQIRSHSAAIVSLGINPNQPVSVTSAVEQLRQADVIGMEESNYVSRTIIATIKTNGLEPISESGTNVGPDKLNAVLGSILMAQSLLPKLTSTHQITTFYQAAYFELRQRPSQTTNFLNAYRIHIAVPNVAGTSMKRPISGAPVVIAPTKQPVITGNTPVLINDSLPPEAPPLTVVKKEEHPVDKNPPVVVARTPPTKVETNPAPKPQPQPVPMGTRPVVVVAPQAPPQPSPPPPVKAGPPVVTAPLVGTVYIDPQQPQHKHYVVDYYTPVTRSNTVPPYGQYTVPPSNVNPIVVLK